MRQPDRPTSTRGPTALLIIALLASAGLIACSERAEIPELPPAAADLPEPEGLSSWRRLAIQTAIDGRVWQGARSGFVVLVARDGRLIHAALSGHADIERDIPMSMDTRFQIASMTKPVIATAALMLVEEGKLGLDDRVADYLPGFGEMEVAVTDSDGNVVATEKQSTPMLIRHLLSFSSGLGASFERGPLFDRWEAEGIHGGTGSLASRVDRLPNLPLFEQPGTRWRYGASLDVLARIIEIVAAEPLEVFLHQRIFAPLNMKATHYLKDVPAEPPLAVMYSRNAEGELVPANQEHKPLDWTPGGYGLVSTAPDYMRFALMLWNEGEYDGVRLLQAKTVQQMKTLEVESGVLADVDIEGLGFGLGVSVVADEDKTLMETRTGDFWWSGAYGTHFWISPSTGIVLVVMQQQQMDIDGDAPITPFLVQQFALTD